MRGHMQVIIVGAGLAGLASAVACRDKGHDVQVLESTDRIGGRMATEIIDGCRCDVGFHVLHTAYPTLERWIDMDALEAGPMDPVTGLIDPRTGRQSMLGDPLRAPSTLIGTLRTSGVWDGLRMLAWRRRAKKAGWDRPDEGLALLDDLRSRGFSESFLDEVIIPLFRGILLDPEVRTSAAFASFVWHAMASGPLVLPKEGIGAVPNQLAARLPEGCVRTSTRVRSVTSRTVELEEGDHLEADLVLIATAHRSARMLVHGGAPSPPRARTASVHYLAETAPIRHPRLLLNRRHGLGDAVLHVHVPTLVHPSWSPDGRHLVHAVTIGEHAHAQIEPVVRGELEQWFGPDVRGWTHVTTQVLHDSLPEHGRTRMQLAPFPSVRIIGDHTVHGSVHGTLQSVERLLDTMDGG